MILTEKQNCYENELFILGNSHLERFRIQDEMTEEIKKPQVILFKNLRITKISAGADHALILLGKF